MTSQGFLTQEHASLWGGTVGHSGRTLHFDARHRKEVLSFRKVKLRLNLELGKTT